MVSVTGLLHHAGASPLTAGACFTYSHHTSQPIENTGREKTAGRSALTFAFSSRFAVALTQLIENTPQEITLYESTPPQLLENKAQKNAFYSRAPKIELYENKRQSAILIAAQTPVFRLELRKGTPATLFPGCRRSGARK